MTDRLAQCPVCGTLLDIPPGCADCYVHCGLCTARFKLPSIAVTDEAVASWLEEETPPVAPLPKEAAGEHPTPVVETATAPPGSAEIDVIRIDSNGVLLEFPAARLLDTSFRAAVPRRCLRCGCVSDLQAHPIIFVNHITDDISQSEHAVPPLVLSDEELRTLSDEEMLERMPRVPKLPHPANLPMPYWRCSLCRQSGAVAGQIQIDPQTGQGRCRLWITELPLAAGFLSAAGAEGTREHKQLLKRISLSRRNPWQNLCPIIRRRIEAWFHPRQGERFVAYVPDRNHRHGDDGLAGVVISSARLVYHSPGEHRESRLSDAVELDVTASASTGDLHIRAPKWEVPHIPLDSDGLNSLRRAVRHAHCRAHWY